MKRVFYTLASISLVILSILGIYIWEIYLKEELFTTEVIVATKVLQPHTVISEEDVKIVRRDPGTLPPDYIVNMDEIIGKETAFGLVQNDVVTTTKIAIYENVQENMEIFPIPNSWIEAAPGSLRKNDAIDIYTILPENKQDQETNSEEDGEDSVMVQKMSPSDPILEDIKVAFIKDSSNQAVKPVEGSESGREDLTAYAYQIELYMNKKEFLKIKEAYENGFKLLFSY